MAEFLQEILFRFPHFRKSKPLRGIGEAPTCGAVKSPFMGNSRFFHPNSWMVILWQLKITMEKTFLIELSSKNI
jgi:hypothetical protein